MAWIDMEYGSKALGMSTRCMVLLPEEAVGIGMACQAGHRAQYPVLWLLHGMSDDCSIWLRRTAVERYVSGLGLAVVMPQVHLSRYHNMRHGPRYFDFLADELPEVVGGVFPISRRRADNFVAGLSMGGHGALLLAMARSGQYAAAGCFSSGNLLYADPSVLPAAPRTSGGIPMEQAVYGTTDRRALHGDPAFDLFAMAEAALSAQGPLPRIYHACGTEDFLLDCARETAAWYRAHPAFDYTYAERPGAHSWDFWDAEIRAFLSFIGPDLAGA